MYFSRLKLTQPLPPCPASTRILASSTNFSGSRCPGQPGSFGQQS
jgi:hypothetical protein